MKIKQIILIVCIFFSIQSSNSSELKLTKLAYGIGTTFSAVVLGLNLNENYKMVKKIIHSEDLNEIRQNYNDLLSNSKYFLIFSVFGYLCFKKLIK